MEGSSVHSGAEDTSHSTTNSKGREHNRMSLKRIIATSCACTIISSCSTVQTEIYPVSRNMIEYYNSEELPITGMQYFLPQINVRMTFTRTAINPADAAKAAKGAKSDLDTAKAEVKLLEDDVKHKTTRVKDAKDKKSKSHAALGELEKELARAHAALMIAQRKQASAEEEHKKAVVTAALAAAGNSHEDTIKLEVLPPTADTSMIYVAKLDHIPTRSDKFTVETNAAGLLTSSNADIEDKSGDIVVRLAKIAIGSFKAASALSTGPGSQLPADQVAPPSKLTTQVDRRTHLRCLSKVSKKGLKYQAVKPLPSRLNSGKIEIDIDPTKSFEVARINKTLCQLEAPFEVKIYKEHRHPSGFVPPRDPKSNRGSDDPPSYYTPVVVDGLVYRRPLAYIADVRQFDIEDRRVDPKSVSRITPEARGHLLKSTRLFLPNEGPTAVLPFDAGACVSNKYGVKFTDGMPVKREETRPSEVFECLEVPLEIVQQIVSLPTELIQLKVDHTTKATELLEAEKKLLDAQQALATAQQNATSLPRTNSGLVSPP